MGRKDKGGCCTVQLPWDSLINLCEKEAALISNNNYILQDDNWYCIPEWLYDLKGKNIRNCLDIGCGSGILSLYSKKLFKCDVYCTDIFEDSKIKSLAPHYNLTFQINNIETDFFPWPQTFDIIIFANVLEYLNFHPKPTLEKIKSLLSENGKFYLSTPDASERGIINEYYDSLDDMPLQAKSPFCTNNAVYYYNREELLQLLSESGFKLEKIDYSKYLGPRQFYLELMQK